MSSGRNITTYRYSGSRRGYIRYLGTGSQIRNRDGSGCSRVHIFQNAGPVMEVYMQITYRSNRSRGYRRLGRSRQRRQLQLHEYASRFPVLYVRHFDVIVTARGECCSHSNHCKHA